MNKLVNDEMFAAKIALNTQMLLEQSNDFSSVDTSYQSELYSCTAKIIEQGQKENTMVNGSAMKLADYYWGADLSDIDDIKKISNMLSEQQPEVRFLINNTGLAKMASYNNFSQEEIIRTIDVNCKAPILLYNVCIPYMKSGSNILNISSTSAFQ